MEANRTPDVTLGRPTFATGYYAAETVRDSMFAKLTTAEMLAEVERRLRAAGEQSACNAVCHAASLLPGNHGKTSETN